MFLLHCSRLSGTRRHLPVLSHRPSPSPAHSGQIYSDFVSFSALHQQTCTTRVQMVLKERKRRAWQIRVFVINGNIYTNSVAAAHHTATHFLPKVRECTFTSQPRNTDI